MKWPRSWVDVTKRRPMGHGERFIDDSAVEQLVDRQRGARPFDRASENMLGLHSHDTGNGAHAVPAKSLGDVTSLNITTLQADVRVGDTYAYNCVPPVRTFASLPHVEPATIGTMLDTWCTKCSRGPDNAVTTWIYIGDHGNDMTKHALTATDPADNPWYQIFSDAIAELGIAVQPQVLSCIHAEIHRPMHARAAHKHIRIWR
jgi:aminoacylase